MKNVLVFGGLRIHTVPKVASTSISAAMATSDFRRATPHEESDDWRFMVVRHPLERLVSAWQFFTPAKRLQHMRDKTEHGKWQDYFNGAMARDALAHYAEDLELYENAT